MKKLTILLLTFSLALGCLMLWQWTHTELVVSARSVRTVPAAEMKSNYEAVARAVRNRSLQGIVYHADALREMNGCYFRFFTLTLQNRGLLPAEMTELQLSPFPEDICAYLPREEVIIPPGGKKDVQLTLLTADVSRSLRDVIITCYQWGHPFRQKITLNRSDYTAEAEPVNNRFLSFLFPSARAEEEALPGGFAYVKDLVPDCIEQMRYAGEDNFVGTVVDGYLAPRAVLTREAAEALQKAAELARAKGYRLVIFDAYRPQRAVDHFLRWAADPDNTKTQAHYYPDIKDKRDILKNGYVAARSGHSRGSTVDLTLADENGVPVPMGTDFDWFGPRAGHGAKGLTKEETANRRLLRSIMEKAGFKAYKAEWWHYTLKNEPYPGTYFDFPVQ